MKRIIIDNIETKYLISENGEVFYEQKLSKNCKPVIAYKDGVKIGEYPSIAKAAECLQLDGSSISKVCKNKQKSTYGYTFEYLEKGSTVIS